MAEGCALPPCTLLKEGLEGGREDGMGCPDLGGGPPTIDMGGGGKTGPPWLGGCWSCPCGPPTGGR